MASMSSNTYLYLYWEARQMPTIKRDNLGVKIGMGGFAHPMPFSRCVITVF